jgi:hypothetical protein
LVYRTEIGRSGGRKEGTVSGDTAGVETVEGGEGSDAYVVVKKMEEPKEEEGDKHEDMKQGDKQTKDQGTRDAQAKKDEGQNKGKAGKVRKGGNDRHE